MAAVGHRTEENLKLIKKSTIKMVKNVEFDAYLCDTSALKPFREVLKKLKGAISCLNITIRRIENLNEFEMFCYLLYRLVRLKRLRFEFASTDKINGESIKVLARSYKRCQSLRVLQTRLVFIPTLKQGNFKHLACSFAKLGKLDDLTYHVQTVYTPRNVFEDHKHKIPCFKNAKKLQFKTSAKTGWTSMTDGSGEFFPSFIRSFPKGINPVELTQIYDSFPISTEAVEEMTKMVPMLGNLRSYHLEISNSQFSELELMLFAEGFANCKQLKKLYFKSNERMQVSIECLYEFIKIIADLAFLENFDLFFRKLKYPEFERLALKDILSQLDNVDCVLTKESLHAFRRKKANLEIEEK